MKPALSDEPTTNETPLARAAGKTWWSAFSWSISEYCEASRQTSGSATSSSFMIGSGLFTPRPQPLMIPSSRIRVRAGKAPLRAISNCSSHGDGIVGREVVHEDDIERIKAKPLQTVLNRALHVIRCVVEDQVVRRRREGKILLGVILPRRLQQLSHLGREDIVAAILGVEDR